MLWDFGATVAAAFAVAGLLLFLMRVLRVRLPKWIVPAAAGAAMLGYAIWSEYSWFPRVSAALPDTVVIASQNAESAWWRPWTYLAPLTSRFIAVDRGSIRTHDAAPGQRLVDVLLVARWQGAVAVPVLYDCPGARRADLIGGADFAADGTVADAEWRELDASDPVLRAACAEG
jgi:hypothetical protein